MIQEIEPLIYDPEFRKTEPKDDDKALVYYGKDGILLKYENGRYILPSVSDVIALSYGELAPIINNSYYLFSIDNVGYYLMELTDNLHEEIPFIKSLDTDIDNVKLYNGIYTFMRIHRFRELDPVHMVFAGATGIHIRNWKETVKYCGKCGNQTRPSDTERAFVCSKCGYTAYPKISPAVIVAVINNDRILLVRNLHRPGNVRLELVSGFVEIGESFEHAVHREVLEEVGLKVKNLRIYKDQPWGISGAHMIGYVAEVDGDDTVVRQVDEISEAKWYRRDEIPEYRNRLSVGSEMILKFKQGQL